MTAYVDHDVHIEQCQRLETLQRTKAVGNGSLMALAREVGAGNGCSIRGLEDLTHEQMCELLERMENIK